MLINQHKGKVASGAPVLAERSWRLYARGGDVRFADKPSHMARTFGPMADPVSHSTAASALDRDLDPLRSLSPEDSRVVARVGAGDIAAFEDLFTAYYESLYALAYRYLGAREPAEDAVQDVFRRIWQRHAEWLPRGPVRAYLVTATRNECLNALRADARARAAVRPTAWRDVVPGMAVPQPPVDSAVVCAELAVAIEQAASDLAPRCREVFLRRWQQGLTIAETAGAMRISVKSVEAHMTRALFFLRERLRSHLAP
jgi:RNA polymerase sigma-70 factor, ECF subfamily